MLYPVVIATPETSNVPELILPPSILLALVVCNVDMEIAHKMHDQSAPRGCPLCRIYVPEPLRARVVEWVHTLPASTRYQPHPVIVKPKILVA